MEPEVKTLLTQKIREAEREPVAWNKAEVWLNVQQRVSTRYRRPAYHYAAAGVTFLLCGTLFIWQMNPDVPVKKDMVESVPAEIASKQKQVAIESKGKEKVLTSQVSFVKRVSSEEASLVVEEFSMAQPEQQEEVIMLKEVVEEPVVAVTIPEETILPIVGVMPMAEQNQVVSTKAKRKKLRTLEPIDKAGTEPTPNLILARIK